MEKEIDPQVRQIADEIAQGLEGLSPLDKLDKLFDLLLIETEGQGGW